MCFGDWLPVERGREDQAPISVNVWVRQKSMHQTVGKQLIAARALATYLIPGCVGRGVRLGSENSSGGNVWKSGDLEILEFGDLGNPEIWRSGDLEMLKPGLKKKQTNKKSQNSNPFCPPKNVG